MSLIQIPPGEAMSSYIMIPAITAVASRCSRFCGFTDLAQSISLLSQGEYSQAGGKALEGTLRLGMVVAVVWSLNEISNLKERNAELLFEKNFWEKSYQHATGEEIRFKNLHKECDRSLTQLQKAYGIQ